MRLLMILMVVVAAAAASAQELPTPEAVSIRASDGLQLRGDLYRPADREGDAPALLLLHMLGSERDAYEPLLPSLLDAGYIVLNMDLRGHGETAGSQDWGLAQQDVQTTLDWLREQQGVADEQIAIIGASVGSNLALVGCANDEFCVTAVALSPGLDYRGIEPESAITEGLAERSALLIAAHDDSFSRDTVIVFFGEAPGDIAARLYPGRAHGTALFREELESVSGLIVEWLGQHLTPME